MNCMPMFEYRKLRCLRILPAVSPETKCEFYPQSDELTPAKGGIHHPIESPASPPLAPPVSPAVMRID